MSFEAIVSAFSFAFDVIKEVVQIKKKLPAIYISSATIVADRRVNPESFYVDCFAANNSSRRISIAGFGIVKATGEEFSCSIDDLGKFGGVIIADHMPLILEPDEMKRIIIEFNYGSGLSRFMKKINGRNGRRLYLRAHTNVGDLGTFIWTNFHESMEDWYWSRLHDMRGAQIL